MLSAVQSPLFVVHWIYNYLNSTLNRTGNIHVCSCFFQTRVINLTHLFSSTPCQRKYSRNWAVHVVCGRHMKQIGIKKYILVCLESVWPYHKSQMSVFKVCVLFQKQSNSVDKNIFISSWGKSMNFNSLNLSISQLSSIRNTTLHTTHAII